VHNGVHDANQSWAAWDDLISRRPIDDELQNTLSVKNFADLNLDFDDTTSFGGLTTDFLEADADDINEVLHLLEESAPSPATRSRSLTHRLTPNLPSPTPTIATIPTIPTIPTVMQGTHIQDPFIPPHNIKKQQDAKWPSHKSQPGFFSSLSSKIPRIPSTFTSTAYSTTASTNRSSPVCLQQSLAQIPVSLRSRSQRIQRWKEKKSRSQKFLKRKTEYLSRQKVALKRPRLNGKFLRSNTSWQTCNALTKHNAPCIIQN